MYPQNITNKRLIHFKELSELNGLDHDSIIACRTFTTVRTSAGLTSRCMTRNHSCAAGGVSSHAASFVRRFSASLSKNSNVLA